MICLVCNNGYKAITNTHLKKHNLTKARYKVRYPGASPLQVMSEERIEKIRLVGMANKGRKGKSKKSYSFPKGYTPWNKGLTKETDARVSKMAAKKTGIYVNEGKIINRHTPAYIAARQSPRYREKMRQFMLRRWKEDLNFVRKVTRRQKKNKLESQVEQIMCEVFNDLFIYTGDGTFRIDGLNPDFIHVAAPNVKLAIDVFGDYWHKNENPQNRILRFRKEGWELLVVWEKELKTETGRLLFYDKVFALLSGKIWIFQDL